MMGPLLGIVVALVAVLLVLEPLLRAGRGPAAAPTPLFADSDDEDDPLLARRDRALAALKEIDFDRATGKLADDDYELLKAQFTAEALEALKAVDAIDQSPSEDTIEVLIASARGIPTLGFCIE